MKWQSRRYYGVALTILLAAAISLRARDSEPDRIVHANYKQAFHYNSDFLRQFIYSTSVSPQWIGKTDVFWYAYRTSRGTDYWRVDSKAATKTPLFDRAKLATQLSELTQNPIDPVQLPLTRPSMNAEGTKLKFVVGEWQYEWELPAEKLTKLGKAPPATRPQGGRGEEGFRRRLDDQERREDQQDQRRDDQQQDQQQQEQDQRRDDQQQDQQQEQERRRDEQERRIGRGGGQRGSERGSRDPRVFSPDRGAYVFVRNHNLYLLEGKEKPLDNLMMPLGPPNVAVLAGQLWMVSGGASRLREVNATQLSTDGVEAYGFGTTTMSGASRDDGQSSRPRVEWARDSKAFYTTRTDSRGVQELFLINPLATPRPTLEKFRYAMPGEDAAPNRIVSRRSS